MQFRLFAALLGAALAAPAQVSITWIGQACFVLRSADGVVVTDPPVASVGYRLPPLTADAVTITHNHTDHNNSTAVSGSFTLVDGRTATARQEVVAGKLSFVVIPGFHDNTGGSQRGANALMRWTQDGLRFAHFGDLGQEQLTAAQLADLANLDVLFIPAGGFFTIAPERAAQYVRELQPKVAILMHYRTALGGPAQLAGLPDSAAPFPAVVFKPSGVTVSRATLPASTETWVMLPASDATAVNAASFEDGAPVAPGSVVSVFGAFTGSATGAAPSFPLPRKLGETELLVNGQAAPLYYASSGQINAQVPAAQAAGQVVAEVRVAGQSLGRAPLTVVPNAPGIFGVVNQDGKLNALTAPARRGQFLIVFATGIGAVSPAVADGAAAPSVPPAAGLVAPNVFLAGRQLPVEFSGLAPGFAGLWQLNVRVPADSLTGDGLPLTVVSGLTSKWVNVTVAP